MVVRQRLAGHPHMKLSLVGSRAAGTARPRSDFDFVVDAGKPLPPADWHELLDGIRDLPTLYKIEVVDWRGASEDFKQLATPQAITLLDI